MKKTYLQPITEITKWNTKELMIPSLVDSAGNAKTPLNPAPARVF